MGMSIMKVTYFSWLRTKTGCADEMVNLPPDVTNVGELITFLGGQHPGLQEIASQNGSIRCTINRRYVDFSHPVNSADDVTIFPPVTGG